VELALDGLEARLLQGTGVGDNDVQNPPPPTSNIDTLNLNGNTGTNDGDTSDNNGVAALFTTPTPVVLQPPATRRTR
jgi:hypothetical protein